jgi:hypothetical protein
MSLEDRIRQLAHRIWEHEGRPDGRHHEHWEQARREMEFANLGGIVGPAPSGGSTLAGADEIDTGMPDVMGVDDMGVTGSLGDRSDAWPSTGRSKLVGT